MSSMPMSSMPMSPTLKITYGLSKEVGIDVTDICRDKLLNGTIIRIPSEDCRRATFFTDPYVNKKKYIFVEIDGINTEYDDTVMIVIDISDNKMYSEERDLLLIQKDLKLLYGDFAEEVPEQKMVANYLIGNEKVLEIGANIGRNSLIIGSILRRHGNPNFVSLECDPISVKKLTTNRDINDMDFKIEGSALSKRKLIQHGWTTIESDVLLPGYTNVNNISWEELNAKYNIEFDTLVMDCEGAFYYILMDMPEILTNIKTIIMENDYWDMSHKLFIDDVIIKNGFQVYYVEGGGWGPCIDRFFEIWVKK